MLNAYSFAKFSQILQLTSSVGVPTTLNILSSWSKTSRTPENNQFFLMLSYKGMVKQGQNTSSEAWYIGTFIKTASDFYQFYV